MANTVIVRKCWKKFISKSVKKGNLWNSLFLSDLIGGKNGKIYQDYSSHYDNKSDDSSSYSDEENHDD